ncbi:MAG: AAA family ATPase [Candidatus Omnitrophica bacterium]|nr:AAA family ATPase [Candidatus Omnitrophota bacterium]
MKNIVLLGFMGTGKTAVARKLAESTGRKYISIDEMIVEKEKMPIKDIFSRKGEAYFRKIEKETVREVSAGEGLVIDTGGGVVMDSENMVLLSERGETVCLWASPEVIRERTSGHGHRPLLNVEDPERKIRELLENRRPFYQKADIHIQTDGKSVNDVVETIKGRLMDEEE